MPLTHPLVKPPAPGSTPISKPNLRYSQVSTKCYLDFRRPANGLPRVPCVLLFHGGGWSSGSRTDMNAAAALLNAKGFATATVGYRLTEGSGAAPWPAQIIDARQAARWLLGNAANYGVWEGGVLAAGASAGGHIAFLLGALPTEDPKFNTGTYLSVPSKALAVECFYPPTDLRIWEADTTLDIITQWGIDHIVTALLGGHISQRQAQAIEASPTTWAASSAPVAFTHGDKDQLVPFSQSRICHAAVLNAGGRSELHLVPGGTHGFGLTNAMAEAMSQRFIRRLLEVSPL